MQAPHNEGVQGHGSKVPHILCLSTRCRLSDQLHVLGSVFLNSFWL